MRIRLDDGLKEPHEDGERNDAVIKPCPRVTQQHAPVCVRAEREVARVNEQHENGGRLDHGNQATVELVNEHGEVDDGRKQLPRLPSYRLGEAAATLTRAQPRSDTTSGLHGPKCALTLEGGSPILDDERLGTKRRRMGRDLDTKQRTTFFA